jgi:hypothetical protein
VKISYPALNGLAQAGCVWVLSGRAKKFGFKYMLQKYYMSPPYKGRAIPSPKRAILFLLKYYYPVPKKMTLFIFFLISFLYDFFQIF